MSRPKGYKVTRETKLKISIGNKGNSKCAWNKGLNKVNNPDKIKYGLFGDSNPSKRPEVRKKISKALKGRDCYWNRGKFRSLDTRKKISEKNRGKNNG
jgi:hypothetical protein